MTKFDEMRVANVLKKMGFKKIKSDTKRFWRVILSEKGALGGYRGTTEKGLGSPFKTHSKSMH